MKHLPDFQSAILYARDYLIRTGQIITTESWQGIKQPREMFESFDFSFQCPLPEQESSLKYSIEPNLPWADIHFQERISGIPYNPPPSHKIWGQGDTEIHKDEKFSHTYPERFWPKIESVNVETIQMGEQEDHTPIYGAGKITENFRMGIRYRLGDLDDLIHLLYREPHTRQAYLPIWFPEDTGAVLDQRVPCTLGYLFRMVRGHLHITYKIRSCDYFRHFRDDLYLAARLLFYILNKLQGMHPVWLLVKVGMFKFQADSFHCFGLEKDRL